MGLIDCSGQNLTALEDRDTCPTAPEAPQADDERNTPIGSHSTPRRNPELTFGPEERTFGPSIT